MNEGLVAVTWKEITTPSFHFMFENFTEIESLISNFNGNSLPILTGSLGNTI